MHCLQISLQENPDALHWDPPLPADLHGREFFVLDHFADLLADSLFLQLVCRGLTEKIAAITALDAAPCSLTDRVRTYMRYKCPDGVLKGVEQAAFRLHCSPRQLQRILNRLAETGDAARLGKGTYQLVWAE